MLLRKNFTFPNAKIQIMCYDEFMDRMHKSARKILCIFYAQTRVEEICLKSGARVAQREGEKDILLLEYADPYRGNELLFYR